VGCALFCLIAKHLIEGCDPVAAIDQGWCDASEYYRGAFASELGVYAGIFPARKLRSFAHRSHVKGSGYVVDALQGSVWCLLNSDDFEATVLAAVNLGDDTDTTAAIAGGLAGLYYGLEEVPRRWRSRLARRDDLRSLFNAFAARVSSNS
jgi:ADP-ribosylglycohydrolase